MNYKHVTIFLLHGETLRFENVTNYAVLEDKLGGVMITFNYVSASDKLSKKGFFKQSAIAGISVAEYDEREA